MDLIKFTVLFNFFQESPEPFAIKTKAVGQAIVASDGIPTAELIEKIRNIPDFQDFWKEAHKASISFCFEVIGQARKMYGNGQIVMVAKTISQDLDAEPAYYYEKDGLINYGYGEVQPIF